MRPDGFEVVDAMETAINFILEDGEVSRRASRALRRVEKEIKNTRIEINGGIVRRTAKGEK